MIELSDKDRQQILARLQGMQNAVKLVHFTQELDCDFCGETKELLETLASLSGRISLEVHNLQLAKDKAAQYGIDKVPATVIEGARDYGIRLYGLPAGYEFVVLLEDILRVSRGESGLSAESVAKLRSLAAPVHLQVFVTPTCPYCPGATLLAHQLALESEQITADMVEATEFPDLVRRYNVRGVPKTIVNGKAGIEGSLPEPHFIDGILAAVNGHGTKGAAGARR